MAKAKYRNYIKNEASICQALMDSLRDEGDLSRVTVTDIVERAGINRGTFYHHFKNVNEVVERLEDSLMDEFLSGTDQSIRDGTLTVNSFFERVTQFFKAHDAAFKSICPAIPDHVFSDFEKKIFERIANEVVFKLHPEYKGNPTVSLSLRIIGHGAAGIYFDYFMGAIDNSLEEIEAAAKGLYKGY